MMNFVLVLVSLLSVLILSVAGPLTAISCQTLCNMGAVACYSAAGLTFGTITLGAGVPAAAVACSAGQGLCTATCIATGVAPTP
jgi:hypothetical protein